MDIINVQCVDGWYMHTRNYIRGLYAGFLLIISSVSAFAQEATANLICRGYYLNSMTGPTYVFEQMSAPSADHLTLRLGDGSEADEPEWVDSYVIYRNLPTGPALFSFDWTDSEKEEIKALGVKHYLASFSDALLLSPGDNYYFKRVYYIDEDVPEKIETDGDYLLLPKGLMNVWDERKKGPTPIIDDLARDALVNAPGCGVSADGGYYLVNRKTLDCQVIGGSLLFSIKPEYQE